MASGITHILLMKQLQSLLPEGPMKMTLAAGRDFLQVGAVGPDLPYASIADGDWFLSTQSDLADKFHYEKTNMLVLRAFQRIKEAGTTLTKREKRFLYSFFLGFASHIIADGIIHPFVRDKVGDYKPNQTAHRVLEMRLDVLLFYHITQGTNVQVDLNYSNIHDELQNFYTNFYSETRIVLQLFSELISEVYGVVYSESMINGWVKGLHTMFGVAEGEHPFIYRIIGFVNNFLFSDYETLRATQRDILILEKPADRVENFLHQKQVHFFDDCLPQFYKIFIPFANRSYDYVYGNAAQLNAYDIPSIDLDTGRDLAFSADLDRTPLLWSVT